MNFDLSWIGSDGAQCAVGRDVKGLTTILCCSWALKRNLSDAPHELAQVRWVETKKSERAGHALFLMPRVIWGNENSNAAELFILWHFFLGTGRKDQGALLTQSWSGPSRLGQTRSVASMSQCVFAPLFESGRPAQVCALVNRVFQKHFTARLQHSWAST